MIEIPITSRVMSMSWKMKVSPMKAQTTEVYPIRLIKPDFSFCMAIVLQIMKMKLTREVMAALVYCYLEYENVLASWPDIWVLMMIIRAAIKAAKPP